MGARGGLGVCGQAYAGAPHMRNEDEYSPPGRGGGEILLRVFLCAAVVDLWDVFIRARNGLAHRHAGSLHAADAEMALQAARDTYTRRGE